MEKADQVAKNVANSHIIINEHKLHLDDLINEWKRKDSNHVKDISDKFLKNQKTTFVLRRREQVAIQNKN